MTDESHASGIPSGVLADALEAVRSDPYLAPSERGTSLTWHAETERISVETAQPTLVKRLLLHPEFRVRALRVSDPRGEDAARFGAELAPEQYDSGVVAGVAGSLPLSTLNVSATARSSTRLSRIVSDSVLDNDPRKGEDDG